MDRRAFVGVIAGGLLAASLAADGQQAGKAYWIGAIVVVEELLLHDFARVGMKDGDLLLPRVQITSDDCHEGGLLSESLVTVPKPEPTNSARPFSWHR